MNAPLPFPEPIRLTPELRQKLEAAVDQILTLLDATAPDPDLEPSLGSLENDEWLLTWGTERGRVGDQTQWAGGMSGDMEDEHDGSEPELGATHGVNQARAWSMHGAGDDREQEHDGREPDKDGEPWLGWSTTGATGSNDDRELD